MNKYAEQRKKKLSNHEPVPIKFGRDAFLYLEPHKGEGNKFAQCGSCMMYLKDVDRCSIHGKSEEVKAGYSCGLYVAGDPMTSKEHPPMEFVTSKESGLVDRKVRCENCFYFNDSESQCKLFAHLGLNSSVKPQACCNAQTPRE